MNKVTEFHKLAMQQAMNAEVAKLNGDIEGFAISIKKAYKLEMKAAEIAQNITLGEPTRSVLFRSAATLALECGEIREAERLACSGLSHDPPDEIADELREVIERCNFDRHLSLRGIELKNDELQISLSGRDVTLGMASLDAVTDRTNSLARLLRRTAQRKMGLSYEEKIPKIVKDSFRLYVSIPRAASYAFSIRCSKEKEQLNMFETEHGGDIIQEFLTCTEFISHNEFEKLKSRINSEPFLRNFVKLTEKLAPDGHDIKMVGFTATTEGKIRRINLTTPQKEINSLRDAIDNECKTYCDYYGNGCGYSWEMFQRVNDIIGKMEALVGDV